MSKPAPHPIEGTWLPIKAELSGEAAPDLVLQRTELTLRSGRYKVRFDGQIADSGLYSIAPSSPHPSLILDSRHGNHSGRNIPSIYQLQGDRLRICYGMDGKLPSVFATQTGNPLYLVFYRRKPATP